MKSENDSANSKNYDLIEKLKKEILILNERDELNNVNLKGN